jgi:cell division septation protein DedD
MKLKSLLTTAGLLAAGIAASTGTMRAQGPMYDTVIVDLPYRVTINNTVLEPGHYVIRQLDDPGGGSRVLQIFSNDGMKLDTTVLTIPTLDNNTPEHTKVVLHHYGDDYYFDKIWVQGKNYGYEFPLPKSIKNRINEQGYTVAATYQSSNTQTAQNTPAPAPAPAPAPEPAPAPAPAPQAEMAQNTPPPAPAPEPAPAPAPQQMPTTSIGWLTLMASGSLLFGAGLLLRRVTA